MFSVSTTPDLLAELYEAGTTGIIEHDGWLEAFFEDRDRPTTLQTVITLKTNRILLVTL